MFFFQIFTAFIIILFCTWLLKSLYIIPARHFAIVERLGVYNRTLYPGLNFVFWPMEYLKHIEWTWERKFIRGAMAPFENCQMDIAPVECMTKDQLQIHLDGTLFYNIANPRRAIYESDDVINMFYQTATQAIRNVTNTFILRQLNGQDNIIGSHVREYINDKMKDKYGIACVDFMVQNIKTNDDVVKKSTELYISSNDREAQLEATRLEAEKIKILREARGMTIEQEIEMERAKHPQYVIKTAF